MECPYQNCVSSNLFLIFELYLLILLIYEAAPRLLMLDKPQLSHFVLQLAMNKREIVEHTSRKSTYITKLSNLASFTGYLWACFPDFEISALEGSIKKHDGFRILPFHFVPQK